MVEKVFAVRFASGFSEWTFINICINKRERNSFRLNVLMLITVSIKLKYIHKIHVCCERGSVFAN